MGVVTLNPAWFFSAGIVYYGAALFNLIAIYAHGTSYNQIYVGEIIRYFPKAKFILALRHPNDCILSCFMQAFLLNNIYYSFMVYGFMP